MTKDVLITVSGIQMDIEEEPIELVTIGTYYNKNGKHYVLYEEQPDGNGPVTNNIVKFYENHFEMTKKGGNHSFLVFDKGQKTSMLYQTLIGPLQMDVMTKELSMIETEEQLNVEISYSLDLNYNFISECKVHFRVQARN